MILPCVPGHGQTAALCSSAWWWWDRVSFTSAEIPPMPWIPGFSDCFPRSWSGGIGDLSSLGQDISGIIRLMNPSKSGTVNAVSP